MNRKLIRALMIFSILFAFMSNITVSANAPSGMKDNGIGGIYIDINSAPYTTFAGYSYGQYAYTDAGCAWYASARVNQLTGKGNTIWSGKSWYNSGYAQLGFSRGSTPQSGSLICWSNHVAVLERIDGDTAYISEGGYQSVGSAYGYCKLSTTSVSKISSRNSGFLGYVYFGSNTPPSVSVTTTDVQNVSETNATVYGSVSYSGSKPSEVGIYFGTSPDNMSKVARDDITHNKNPFDMWYDLNSEAGQYLSPGTTYYWQCYAIVNGNETKGDVKSFVSTGTKPTPVPTPTPTPEPTPTPTPMPIQTVKPASMPNIDDDKYQPSVLTVFSGNRLQIAVDDTLVRFPDAQPFIDSNDRTQVPIRAVSEMLNCDVEWISETHTAIITRENGDSIIIVIGSNTMLVNNNKVKMDTAALIKDDRTYIPVRFVAEALGLTVEWE